MATVRSVSEKGSSGSAAANTGIGMVGRSLLVGLVIALGLSIAWQAVVAGQILSGQPSGLGLHANGAYAVLALGVATFVVELVSGWRKRRWGPAWLAGLLATAILAQMLLGYAGAGNARYLAYHVPLGVSIAGLYVYYLTVRLRHLAESVHR